MKKEKKQTEKRAWNPILVLALALVAVFGLSALTYSWLTDSASAAPSDNDTTYENAYIGDFQYDFEYSFDGNTWTDVSGQVGEGGIPVDITNSSAANYIGNLQFRAKQTGSMKSTVRVKFAYQWYKTAGSTETVLQGPQLTLTPTLCTGWSLVNSDGYYHYMNGSSVVFPQGSYVSVCSGFSVGTVPVFNGQLKVVALFDGVQFNRYREVWGIDSLT